jgi:hypothetical protein
MLNGSGHDEDSVLAELRQWREQGASLRSRLEAARDRLKAELSEVESALAELSAGTSAATPTLPTPTLAAYEALPDPDWQSTLRKQGLTAPDLVLATLARGRRWMAAQEIFGIARQINPDLAAELLHSAIYRLVQKDRIQSRGTKGSKMYATLGLEDARVGEE